MVPQMHPNCLFSQFATPYTSVYIWSFIENILCKKKSISFNFLTVFKLIYEREALCYLELTPILC